MKKILDILFILLIFAFTGCQNAKKLKPISETETLQQKPVQRFSWDEDLRPIVVPSGRRETIPVVRPVPAEEKPPYVEKPAAPPVVPIAPAAVKPTLFAVSETSPYVFSQVYPSPDYGIIQLDKVMPQEVELNRLFDYTIKVTNLTDKILINILVTEEIPRNFRFAGSNPTARQEPGKLVWEIDSLGPKVSQQITVTGVATEIDDLKHSTIVTHAMRAQSNVRVVQPNLQLTLTAPSDVLLCDPIPVEYIVSNIGTGSAQDVKIVSALPPGLQTSDGKSELVLDAGTLSAGQVRQLSAELRATGKGVFVNKAVASSATGLKTESAGAIITVRQPVLAITKSGPEKQYVGRSLTYEVTVANTGDGIAKDVILDDTIPAGVTSIEATAGANFSGSKLIWELGTLAPRTSKNVRVSYTPTQPCLLTNNTTANAYCAESVTTSMKTLIAGIAATRLEVIDLEDPLEVGNQTTYVITVSNEGSAPDTNIRIVCNLEDKIQYVSSGGETSGSIMGNTVSFTPLRTLAPKARATWRVVVKGIRPGDVRFRVTMYTDQLVRPVEETEATYVF
jgi:uncharacterized repeat protein (TIGR01451 family)